MRIDFYKNNLRSSFMKPLLGVLLLTPYTLAAAPSADEMWQIIQQQQQTIEALQARLDGTQTQPSGNKLQDNEVDINDLENRVSENEAKLESTATLIEQQSTGAAGGWWNRTAVGGYGSVRFESSDIDAHNTGFTHRRYVLAVNSQVVDRLQTYLELEFERFTELELEKGIDAGNDEFELSQAIEGTNGSEISIEQAWARYTINPGLHVDFGALLVPVGRFNIQHDDNQWVLPRRSLVDRGAPVLPVNAAWTELGAGIAGTTAIGDALLDYRLYAFNGSTVDFEFENELEVAAEDGEDTELESIIEAEFGPSRGAFEGNANDSIAFAGRLGLRPAPGHEIAVSGYAGNYVPSFLNRDETLWSFGIDGLHRVNGFEIEYEVITTHFDNLAGIADSFAGRVLSKEREINGTVEDAAFATHKIEFTLARNVMASDKTGYWIEIRRPFWIDSLNDTFLGRAFSNPQLIPTFRMEQVFFNNQLQSIEFDGGKVTEFRTRDAHVNRATLGLGFRPVPEWVISLAGEYTWTPENSLAGLTNYIAAGDSEDDNFSLLLGASFGF